MTAILRASSSQAPGESERLGSTARAADAAPRLHYFDWLRALTVYGIIFYHTLLPFARDTWNIVNDQQSQVLLAFLYVFESFGLGVLFVIAGGSVRYALERRSMRVFLAERALRLLVPYILGAILLAPPTSYIIGLHQGTVSGSFLSFLAGYPRSLWADSIAPTGFSPEVLTYIGMHLWFLAWLFICSVVAVPLFVFLSSTAGRSLLNALGHGARFPGALLLLAVPMTVVRIILAAQSQAVSGWSLEAFVWFAIIFAVGFVIFSDDRLTAAARRDFWPALFVAVLGSLLFLSPGFVWKLVPQTYGSIPFWTGLWGVTGWAWTLVILGIGMRASFMQRPLPPYAGELSLPAYILHFPIETGISALVVTWPLGFGAKLLLNMLLGAGVSLLVAATVVRIPLLRAMLGLQGHPFKPHPAAAD